MPPPTSADATPDVSRCHPPAASPRLTCGGRLGEQSVDEKLDEPETKIDVSRSFVAPCQAETRNFLLYLFGALVVVVKRDLLYLSGWRPGENGRQRYPRFFRGDLINVQIWFLLTSGVSPAEIGGGFC